MAKRRYEDGHSYHEDGTRGPSLRTVRAHEWPADPNVLDYVSGDHDGPRKRDPAMDGLVAPEDGLTAARRPTHRQRETGYEKHARMSQPRTERELAVLDFVAKYVDLFPVGFNTPLSGLFTDNKPLAHGDSATWKRQRDAVRDITRAMAVDDPRFRREEAARRPKRGGWPVRDSAAEQAAALRVLNRYLAERGFAPFEPASQTRQLLVVAGQSEMETIAPVGGNSKILDETVEAVS